MIRLDTTTRKLQILLAGAVATSQLPVVVCYSDQTAVSYQGGTQVVSTNSTATVDICSAPAASTTRDIDTINVQNADTAAATVTIQYNDNATLYSLFKAVLAVGDQLTYVHGAGWSVKDASGNEKVASAIGSMTSAQLAAAITDETGSGSLVFATRPSFLTTLGIGGATASASGSGMTFPATQAASTDVNTLDDYEEGTWTPSLAFGGASVGITYSVRQGSYVKIGKIVAVWAYVGLSSKGSSTGSAALTGLPFAAGTDSVFYGGGLPYFANTTLVVSAGCAVPSGGSEVRLYNLPGNTITDANMQNTTDLIIGVTYKAAT